jgi:mannose-6-phosphate isomerase-like protein (cupin superfamily)
MSDQEGRRSKITQGVQFSVLAELEKERGESGKPYHEFLRVPALSAGLYVLPAGSADLQKPHHEDEIYCVIRGRARFRAGSEDREVSAGDMIFVAAEIGHRFYDVAEELAVLVLFAPAES